MFLGKRWQSTIALVFVPLSLPFPASAIRELPFLDLRSLAFSDEDFLALTAAFPHTGVNMTWRVSVTRKGCVGLDKERYVQSCILRFLVLFNQIILNDFKWLFIDYWPNPCLVYQHLKEIMPTPPRSQPADHKLNKYLEAFGRKCRFFSQIFKGTSGIWICCIEYIKAI